MTNSKATLSNEEAIATVKDLGRIFVQALFDKVGKKPKSKSELMNGLVAYEQLNLKGELKALTNQLRLCYVWFVKKCANVSKKTTSVLGDNQMDKEAQLTLLYDSMSTAEIKSLLIDVMKEREGLHYVIGWLHQSYCSPTHEDIERAVAIKQLEEYGV